MRWAALDKYKAVITAEKDPIPETQSATEPQLISKDMGMLAMLVLNV